MVPSLARIAPRATRAFVALLAIVASACSDKGAGVILVETEAKPDRLDATSKVLQGAGQQAEVGVFLGSPLTVEIKDGAGMPMRGMPAVWTFTSGGGAEAGSVGGQVSQSLTTTTDNQGRTSVTWRLGTQAGVQTARVSIATNSNGKGKTVDTSIEAMALAGPATQLALDPANLVVPVRGVKNIKAVASDKYGNAVAAGQISWSSSDPSIAQVDGNGNVTGNAAGAAMITALDGSAAAASSVEVENVALSSTLSVNGGNGQTGGIGQALPQAPSVKIVDGNGSPVANATVGWSVTSGGGSLSASTTNTDASGVASVGWTLGSTEGQQTMAATFEGASAQFIATAQASAPSNPGTVGDLQVVSVTSSSVTLRWTQVADGAGAAANYVVRRGSPSLDWASAAAGQATVSGTSVGATVEYTWSGLSAGTAYQFGVAATRTDGGALVYGAQSNQVSAFTTPVTTSSPSQVTDLQVVSVTSSSVTLRWTQVGNGAGGAANYALRRGAPSLSWSSAAGTQVTTNGSTVGSTMQYTWSGLSAGTSYQFAVAATRTDGSTLVYGSPSGTVSASTNPETTSTPDTPDGVTDLQVIGLTTSSVTVRWTEVDDGTGHAAKYALRYGSPSLSWGAAYATEVTVTGTSIGAVRQYTFSGLSSGTSYQFGIVTYRGTLNVDAVFGPVSNYASASTSGSTGPAVASIVASPSATTLSGIGASVQLSAVARDAYGSTVSGVAFQWQSLTPSVATVNGSGLVISQAVGTALIVVSTSCCQAKDTVPVTVQASSGSGGSSAVWEDGFESGMSSSNGYSWANSGSSVFVSSAKAHSGGKSLAFRFSGNTDLTADAMAEQRFTFGESLSEVWIEYWVWVPDNYKHRNGDGPDNNKFFFLWDAGNYPGGARGRLAAMLSAERNGDDTSRLILMWSSEADLMTTADAPSWSPALSSATKGRWNQVRIRVRAATGATSNNGVFQMWWDGNLRISETSLPMFDPDDNKFRNGYLFGWSNSGFDQETTFYVDDFKVYKTNPGW